MVMKIVRVDDPDVLLARKPKKAMLGKDGRDLRRKMARQGKQWMTGEEITLST